MDEEQKKLAEEFLFSEKKPLSFVKKLYFGVFDAKGVFPYPKVSAQEKEKTEALLERVKEFASKEIHPEQIDKEQNIPESVIEGLGALGILSMTIPKEYGGLGMSQYAYCKVEELLSSICGSTALFVNAHQSVGLKALLLFGTDAQKEKWLKKLSSGEVIAAFSLTEKNAGSDAAGIETRAVFDEKEGCYIINGKKQWTTNGAIAGMLTVMAKMEVETSSGRQDKITAFLVTPDMPGFFVTDAALEKVGMRGTKTANLEFKNLKVPKENVLGPIGSGLKVCLTVLDYGRTTFGATCTGSAKKAFALALDHAVNRYQFKRPLASFGLVKKKIAEMKARMFAMEAATYLTAGFVDAGVEDVMLEAAILKVFASESLWEILYEAMQIFGGRSFFTDCPLERMMRDARLNMIGEGANEVLRAFIAAVGLRDVGMELKGAAEGKRVLDFLKRGLSRVIGKEIPAASFLLKKEARQLKRFIRKFYIAASGLVIRHREHIVEEQLALDRIATCAISLYTAAAVLSRLDSELLEGRQNNLLAGKLYCKMAFSKFERAMHGLSSNDDGGIEALSDQMTHLNQK